MAVFGSRALVRKIVGTLRASYWFWPGTLVLGALCLAEVVLWLDMTPGLLPFDLPDRLTTIDAGGARQTLSTLATAVIGVAGVMFSMTLVAVSFAADTFGPRLIGNFMRDRGTQLSFGLLLGCFVFDIVMLRAVQDGDMPFVPYLGLAVALLLTLVAVFTIIFYIHHVPETINVSNIASGLGHRFAADIRQLIAEQAQIEVEDVSPASDATTWPVCLSRPGYVQQMDREALFDCARRHDWVMDVCLTPGEFTTPHTPVVLVHAPTAPGPEQVRMLREAFVTGDDRTESDSVVYIADELVEMIARALSPGFNDPFTAMNCLNWLHAGLLDALLHDGGLDPVATRRVRFRELDFAGLFAASFVAAAPYTTTDLMCCRRHLDLTQDLMRHAPQDKRWVIAELLPALRAPARNVRL